MPELTGILETALYVDDLPRSVGFYTALMDLPTIQADDRFHAFSVAERQVLLLFRRGASTASIPVLDRGIIPPHDGSGPLHVGFAVPAASLSDWEQRLEKMGIPIEGRVHWPRGGESLYIRDPDGHLVELLSPGVWNIY